MRWTTQCTCHYSQLLRIYLRHEAILAPLANWLEEPASEERPMGLVTVIQSTSVLAHKHVSSENLVLPTNSQEERELPHALGKSLGAENNDMYTELSNAFSQRMALLSTNRGWKRGVHIQSRGHHMHFDGRQSYCETLKQQP
jgi:E3 ubiquitin-protein ligase UBR3